MSTMIVEHGTDDVGVLMDFVGNSLWMILERNAGFLWKIGFVVVVLVVLRYYTLNKRSKPKTVVKHHHRDEDDSDEEPAPRHLSSRGRSPHRH